MSKNKIIILSFVFILLITSGFGCTLNPFKKRPFQLNPVTLNVWSVYENNSDLKPLFDKYKELHPTITIKYKKFSIDEYEDQLLEAWAEDRGPDIYFLPNNWIAKYKNKITPLPDKIKLPYREIKSSGIGNFQKTDIIDSVKEVRTTSLTDLIQNYPGVIYEDVVKNDEKKDKIYGLPLSLDTLGLFYNEDLLRYANIAFPPKTWTEFNNMVKNISLLNENGNFEQSGTALGTTNNITNSVDILMLLMFQNGVNLIRPDNHINLGDPEAQDLALEAINFYNDYSNPIKEVYSWNENQDEAMEAFINGQVAFFFGYPYHISQIKSRVTNKFNLKTTHVPQIKDTLRPANFANYWVMTVSHKTKNVDPAWGFIDFATREENVKMYLEKTKKPTALKSLKEKQASDLELKPFVEQILTARSWYRGDSPKKANEYIIEIIDKIKSGNLQLKEIRNLLSNTAIKINQTIK
jgi:ABC-type glycerol-3-phosphate transport system substrate-binding protein